MEKLSARAEISSPVCETGLETSAWAESELWHSQWLCFQRNRVKVCRFSKHFQISAQAGWAETSARAEPRHFIGPLV